eukprot:136314-Pyramimonas_sp.AAC.1
MHTSERCQENFLHSHQPLTTTATSYPKKNACGKWCPSGPYLRKREREVSNTGAKDDGQDVPPK